MGITQSHSDVIKQEISGNQHSHSFEDFSNCSISEDSLIEILSYVPAKDLISNCRLVCKQWRSLIDSQSVWRLKCEKENIKLPSRKLLEIPNHHYRYIYWHSVSKTKNFIKNPCGENKFEGWDIQSRGSLQFAIENPPAGSDPVPAEVGSQSCFATTYTLCGKYQTVNLADNTVNNYLLRHDLVKIKVGEWYAARFDCASEYQLQVILYNKLSETIDQFEFKFVEEQWSGKKWHLVTHEFDNVTDACFISFYHQGNDRQFWAGHYGSKMTGAFIELCIK